MQAAISIARRPRQAWRREIIYADQNKIAAKSCKSRSGNEMRNLVIIISVFLCILIGEGRNYQKSERWR